MFNWLTKTWSMLSNVVRGIGLGDARLVEFLGGGQMSSAGELVTAETSLTVSAMYRAVQLYGETHGVLPLGVYRRGGARRKYYSDHPTHAVLHERPNPEMTAMTFRCLMEAYRILHGNAYAEIEWNGRAQCIGLWPIEPWRVVVQRNPETKKLEYLVDGNRRVDDSDMIHLPNFSWCGTHGLSTIRFARESLGRTLAAGNFGSGTFHTGGPPVGMVKHPGKMEKPARDSFRKEWRENAIKNKGNIGILWEGMDWVNMTMNPEDFQYLATLENGVTEVSRWTNVPPHMLFQMERAINNNAEAGDLAFAKYAIIPLCHRWEQEYNYKLLTPDLQAKYTFEGLLRGDSAARAAWYEKMRGIGIYSPNQILELEDMDDIGPEGDVRVVNAAYIPLSLIEDYWKAKSQPGATPPDVPNPEDKTPPGGKSPDARTPPAPPSKGGEPAPGGDAKKPKKGKLAEDPFYASELSRMQRRETKAIRKAAKHPQEFLKWLDEFYPRHSEVMQEVLTPAVSGFLELDESDPAVAETVLSAVRLHVESRRAALLDASGVPANEFESAVLGLASGAA